MRKVVIQFFKYPDLLHWGHEAFYLGEDEYGTWVGSPVGSRRWRGLEAVHPVDIDHVMCAPHQGWWHLYYNGAAGSRLSHFIDIVTPPVWVSEDRLEMIDLDLDVVRTVDGQVEIEDEDEFAVHQVLYGYPEDLIRAAEEETRRMVLALEASQEPFFEVAEGWLSRLR